MFRHEVLSSCGCRKLCWHKLSVCQGEPLHQKSDSRPMSVHGPMMKSSSSGLTLCKVDNRPQQAHCIVPGLYSIAASWMKMLRLAARDLRLFTLALQAG